MRNITERDSATGLTAMLQPDSVAIIGASDNPARIGGRPIRYMISSGYKGAIYPVNPKYDTIQGLKAYPSVGDIGKPVDCVIIAVPAPMVPQTLEDCATAGVKAAIIFSAGFAEMGAEGESAQTQITEIAGRTGMRILGPNCLGLMSFANRFFATFSSTGDAGYAEAGSLAIISQSGAYGGHIYAVASSWGLGVSHVITTGNECDVDVSECIGWAAESDEVNTIVAYSEGIKNGPALLRNLEKARARGKPVIFMKVGSSEEGAAAAASHTASLAGSDQIYDAVFRQYGVYRAETTEDLLDVAYACSTGIYPRGKKIGLITISGGAGVLMADYASRVGLDVTPMPKEAQANLKKVLPFASPINPVDVTAQFFNDLTLVGKNFNIMLDEGGYDIIVAFFTTAASSPFLIGKLLEELKAVRRQAPDRLIILSLLGTPEVVAQYRAAGFLTFEDPSRAIAAAKALASFGESFARDEVLDEAPVPVTPVGLEIEPGPMSEWSARLLLEDAGVPMAEAVFARTADEVAEAADRYARPVALKVNGAGIAHKTEIGGVVLNVENAQEARTAFDGLMLRAAAADLESPPDGVIVAPMVEGGVETILGVQIDPVFGPAVMFGLGGVFAEVFEDVVFRLVPVGHTEARKMIEETRGAKLLHGVRGKPPADIDALVEAIVHLSRFAARHADTLSSIDLNPFLVLPKGQGVLALDSLIVTREKSGNG